MLEKEKTNVILTNRDIELLESLYANVVMTFGQIARKHFGGVAKPTVLNRLAKLERALVIQRERIPRMTLGLDENAVGVVFQITRAGILELRKRHFSRSFKPLPVKVHAYTLHHDLILGDLADLIRCRVGNVPITNGKLLQGTGTSAAVQPDLVVECPNGKVAVELELSDKSEKRYREIILRYRLSQAYPKVIYFLEDSFIQRLLTKVILGRQPHALEAPQTGKFYFSRLTEFLNNPVNATITNGADDWEKGGL